MKKVGIIAGAGELPIIFARKARKNGVKVVGFAIESMATADFDKECDKVYRLNIGQFKKFLFLLIFERIQKIVMLGKINKSEIYKKAEKDEKAIEFLKSPGDKSDYTLLGKITKGFQKIGIEVISGTEYLSDLFPPKGILTKKFPSENQREDINLGLNVARELARLDIGQSVVVKDKTIVSVEAMEGTDKTIERAAALCGEGFTVVKVPRPKQDMRWDVPVVGPDTLKVIAENKGRVLAIEEKKMFLLKREECISFADKNDISIVVV